MNYANIKYTDISNGDGVRTSLFVSGCNHHCKGCFNECAWDFSYGDEFTSDVFIKISESLDSYYISGLTILGGEPLDPNNINEVCSIVKGIKNIHKDKSIWIYTGYLYEDLINIPIFNEICEYIDVLVDGKFIQELYDISLKFRGSSNQRIIDIKQTKLNNEIICYY